MKKMRNLATAICMVGVAVLAMQGCSQFNLENGADAAPGSITLSISGVPEDLVSDGTFLKSGSDTDTNNFILTIYSTSGEKIYDGRYGDRPQEIVVTPGSYDVGIYSNRFSPPKFAAPQYGDEQTIIVEEGMQAKVSFMCRQVNAGLKLKFTNEFLARFPGTGVYLSQDGNDLHYEYSQTKYAFVTAQPFDLVYRNGEKDTVILTKSLQKGQMVTMNLSYSESNTTASVINVQVDTTREWISYDYNVGLKIPTGVYSIEEAKSHIGEKIPVFGYILGGDPTTSSIRIGPPFESRSTIVIAPTMTERNRENMFVVELPSGAVRDALNLVVNDNLLGTPVVITGTVAESYYGYIGIKNTKSYALL